MKPLYSVLFTILFLSSTILMGQTLTYGEVYDFEVGDVFHYRNSDVYGPQDPEGPPSYTKFEITHKNFSTNGDTVFYVRDWKEVQPPDCSTCPGVMTFGTDTVLYANLTSNISGGPIPIWDANNCMLNWSSYMGNYMDTTFNYSPQFFNVPSVNKRFEVADSCKYQFPFEFDYTLNVFSKGLGMTLYKYDHCTSGNQDHDCYNDIAMVYYKKGQTTGGTPVDLLNSVTTLNPESDLRIFPNPFNEEFTIKSDGSNITQVVIYDLLGNEILLEQSNGSSFQFNLRDMESGIYVISITQENGEQTFHRIVKR